MPHLHSFRQGWQSENIARFLLSKFSFIAKPSTISDDLGSDFFCTLFKIKKNELHPNSSFAIQIKSKGDNKIDVTNKISYLGNLEIPFFVGVIDKKNLKIIIYAGEYLCDYFSSSELRDVKKIYVKLVEKREEPLKMFEKSKDGKSSYILFPKVLEIDAMYDYSKEPNKIQDLFSICRLMQENISSKTSHEYTFKKFNNSYIYIYTGSTSIQHFQNNFLKRLAEVFYNLKWTLDNYPSSKQTVKNQFEIYKKLYLDLAKLYEGMPEYVAKGFNELEKLLED
ncbi:MAG: hypothetical protein AABY32_03690 [Nanoarchaeota archaeon]